MPLPALQGTHLHPGIPGATVTAGWEYAMDWARRYAHLPLACDIETFGLGVDARRIKCVTFATKESALVLDPRDPQQAKHVRDLAEYTPRITFHNGPFDVPNLNYNGLFSLEWISKVWDTIITARLAEPGEIVPKTLEACTLRYLGIGGRKMQETFKALGLTKTEGYRRLDIDSPAYLMGAAADGLVTARLDKPLTEAAVSRLTEGHPFAHAGLDWAGAMAEVERQQINNRWGMLRSCIGLKIDPDYLAKYREQNGRELAEAESSLKAVGVDPGNGNHLAAHLEKIGQLPTDHPRTGTGKPSTTAASLEALAHPLAQQFVKAKKLTKLDGYMQKAIDLSDENGRVHPETNFLKAAHGRSSMTGLEIHQFPPGARGIILFDERGVSNDWTAQEPMVAMNLAHGLTGQVDPALEGYERGERIYTFISEYADIPDKQAKIVLLAGMYGEGKAKLSVDLGLSPNPWIPEQTWAGRTIPAHWGYQAAADLQEATFSPLQGVTKLLSRTKTMAKSPGLVFTVAGRILPIPRTNGQPHTHKGPDFMICGSAYDMATDVINVAWKEGWAEHLYFNMHDEFLSAMHVSHRLREVMQTPSERFVYLARRVPKIRTDMNFNGERWIYT